MLLTDQAAIIRPNSAEIGNMQNLLKLCSLVNTTFPAMDTSNHHLILQVSRVWILSDYYVSKHSHLDNACRWFA